MTASGFDAEWLEVLRAKHEEALETFPLAVAKATRRLFWREVALNIRATSPLTYVVAREAGLDVDGVIRRISPPAGWPTVRLPLDHCATTGGKERYFDFRNQQMIRRHRLAGVLVQMPSAADDVFGLRFLRDSLEVTAVRGLVRLETYHGYARMIVAQPIPETISASAAGSPISRLIDHPWFSGASWPILEISRGSGFHSEITIDTGQIEWRLGSGKAAALGQGTVR